MNESTRKTFTRGALEDRLVNAIIAALPSDLAPAPRVIFSDWDNEGCFRRLAGLARVRETLEACRHSGAYPSFLMVGLFPPALQDAVPDEKALAALLHWPGFAYLPYGFTTDQLITTARNITKGTKAPLPAGILPTPADVLRVTSEVRHWLENRLRNTTGTLIDFRNAATGSVQLHSVHLQPITAITPAHLQMLDGLWNLEAAAEQFAPQIGGLRPIRIAIAEFELYWQSLEALRAEIRSESEKEHAQVLSRIEQKLHHACLALKAAIDATNRLSMEIAKREKR